MKVKLIAGLLLAGAIPLVFSACKDDEVPKSGISFEVTEEEVFESDGTAASFHPDLWSGSKGHDIIVKLVLDRPLAEAVVLKYALSGTAISENPSDDFLVNDFAVKDGTNTSVGADRITITKGASEATIKITVYEDILALLPDYDEEQSETVILTLQSVESGPGTLAAGATYTLTINEDDSFLVLSWMDETSEAVDDNDMDLFLWNEGEVVDLSNNPNPEDPEEPVYEVLFLYGGYPEGDYGVSYNFYSGSSNSLLFAGMMIGYWNDEYYSYDGEGDVLAYGAKYTQQNINQYDTEGGTDPLVVQTITKDGIYYYPSEIEVPETGSRSGGSVTGMKFTNGDLKKFQDIQLRSLLQRRDFTQKTLFGVPNDKIDFRKQ